jgi:DNA recombination-dependent growth factor C
VHRDQGGARQRGEARSCRRSSTIEQQTGRRPKGKQARELKEAVVHALLPRAFPKRTDTLVWLDPGARWCGWAPAARRRPTASSRG